MICSVRDLCALPNTDANYYSEFFYVADRLAKLFI